MDKWIQKLKKGALHRQMGIPEDKKIPRDALVAAAKKRGLLGKRARNAIKLAKIRARAFK